MEAESVSVMRGIFVEPTPRSREETGGLFLGVLVLEQPSVMREIVSEASIGLGKGASSSRNDSAMNNRVKTYWLKK